MCPDFTNECNSTCRTLGKSTNFEFTAVLPVSISIARSTLIEYFPSTLLRRRGGVRRAVICTRDCLTAITFARAIHCDQHEVRKPSSAFGEYHPTVKGFRF